MKTVRYLTPIIIFVCFISFSSEAFGQNGSKVLLLPREGYSGDLDLMIKMEVGVMTLLLKNAGFDVEMATTAGGPILGPTQRLDNVMRIEDTSLSNYKGVILACMAVGSFPGAPVSKEAMALVKQAVAEGKPVAANANSTIVLAEAGLLKGKRYAFVRDPLKPTERFKTTDLRFVDGIYEGPGVVQDGKIITSGVCPNIEKLFGLENATVKLTRAFIAELSK